VLIDRLLAAKAIVLAHDPVAQENVQAIYGDKITCCPHHYDTLDGADALAIVTEWNEFRNPDFEYLKHKMKQPVIFDGRNLYEPKRMRELGFTYSGIGLHS
jgi:UDPglucose 6-dehydrogenase